ncbi:MAG: ATP-binding protein [Defluviitaleaceae bacterium]|nr:ATP-binding protein [Defluviitaleaceae bacterium]
MLKTGDFNKGLINTVMQNCIDCNKCIHECPIVTSNVSITDSDGNIKMCVDEKECILCGTCLDTCIHNARKYKDDLNEFLQDLEQGIELSILIAPAFYLNYPDEYKKVIGYLKSLGVKNFYSLNFGAEITVWGYINYIAKHKTTGNIAQPCPSIVSHIEKHSPKLLSKIIPVQSPMMCTAIYLKKYKNISENLVFLSPCISKKIEIQSKRGLGLIKHNITFKNLLKHISREKINLKDYPDVEALNNVDIASIFPKPGGLKENLEHYMGAATGVFQIEGERKVYNYFDYLAANIDNSSEMPMFIDALNCEGGCIYGTGTEFRRENNHQLTHKALAMREKIYKSMKNETSPLEKLNEQFKEFNIEDFMCEYEEDTTGRANSVSDEVIDAIFNDRLRKLTENDRHVDCAACGYKTCRDMAKAIALGINHRGNCIYYVKDSLFKSEERLRTVIDNMPLVANIINKDFKLIECNESALRLFGLETKKDYFSRFLDLSPTLQPDGNSSVDKINYFLTQTFRKGYIRFEWMHQKLDGTPIPCEVSLIRVSWRGEDHVLTFLRDLREQKKWIERINAALDREQAASNSKSLFLSNMSHEIRTPMNAIIGMASIGKNSPEPERKDYAFDKIENASRHLLGVVNDVLDMSKIEANKFKLSSSKFNFKKMINRVVSIVELLISEKYQELVIEIDPKIPSALVGDEQKLAQAITNLLSNAIKFTPEKGCVKLSALYIGKVSGFNKVQIVVSDTGIGISEEHMQHLFSPFEQAEKNTSRKYGGTGLGLTITKSIIEMMDGEINVESIVGEGTAFSLIVPFPYDQSDEYSKNESLSTDIPTDISFKGRCILLAEDVELNREIVLCQLEDTGIKIDCAANGKEAIEMITANPNRYELILMDIQMPEMDGVEATRHIRKLQFKSAQNIPIIALTANVFQEDIDKYKQAGMNDHLGKPLDLAQIINKLDMYLNSKPLANIIV